MTATSSPATRGRFAVGTSHPLPPVIADQSEMTEFAQRFDPQAIHLDAEAAARSGFDTKIASGWYICALFMRQFVRHVINGSSALVSPGVESIRWLSPLRAGESFSGTCTVTRIAPSFSHQGGRIAAFETVLISDASGDKIAALTMYCLFTDPQETTP